jgi:hypothetical protein
MMTQRGLAFDQLKQQHVAFARDQIFKEFDAPARAPHCRQTTFGKHANSACGCIPSARCYAARQWHNHKKS